MLVRSFHSISQLLIRRSTARSIALCQTHRPWKGSHTPSLRPSRTKSSAAVNMDVGSTLLAVVGDVHGQWCGKDVAALELLAGGAQEGVMCCLVGDFGNEDINIVRQISDIDQPKAVILGNHDAWETNKVARKSTAAAQPSDHLSIADALRLPCESQDWDSITSALIRLEAVLPEGADNAVVKQLTMLGPTHVGYASQQVPGRNIAIVGSRPFSMGGSQWSSLISTLYPGVDSMADSAARVVQRASTEAAQGNTVVIMSHNAPQGLGDCRHDIAGVDFRSEAGDHGDPDLRAALDQLHAQGVRVPLVLCGHMHHKLNKAYGPAEGGRLRRMVHVDPVTGCVTLNAATVPRVRKCSQPGATEHHFLLVELRDKVVVAAHDTWVMVQAGKEGWDCKIKTQQEVFCLEGRGESGSTYRYHDAHDSSLKQVFVPHGG